MHPSRRAGSGWIQPAKAPASATPPLDGAWAASDTAIDRAHLYPLPSGRGPEDVVVDLAGRLVAGDEDGRLWRWPVPAERDGPAKPQLLADTGGRPLGIEVDPRDGGLIVCDAYRGLLRVTDDGTVETLTDRAAGKPILFCNNATVAPDGTIFFTDSSDRYPISAWRLDILEHRPNGRLLAYDPGSRRTEVVADRLYFPNGVALTPDRSALMLVESTTQRLLRVSLRGGQPAELAELPAYPDNMAAVGDGTYWIALPTPRLPALDRLRPHPGVRRLVALLPELLQPRPKRYGLVARIDGDGRVLRTLHGPAGQYSMVTGVRQHGDVLWLGSLTEPAVARIAL